MRNRESKTYDTLTFRRVCGLPFDDPKGRWRKGGGINVPVILTFSTRRAEALNVMERVRQTGIVVTLSRDDGNCFTEAATTKSLTILQEPTRKLADTFGVTGENVYLS